MSNGNQDVAGRPGWGWAAGLALLVALGGCRPASEPAETRFTVMGTVAAVMAGSAEAARVEAYAATVEPLLRELEAELSIYRPESQLSRLNREAGGAPVPVSPDLRALLELARHYGQLSGGAFDVTVGPLVRAWGFSGGKTPAALPTEAQLAGLAPVDYRRIELTPAGARLASPGMMVDLGGIAKGYAVDRGCEALRRAGASNLLVNLGGNMRGFGEAAPGRRWRVAVRDPFDRARVLGSLELADGLAVATSGNYERFVTIGGRRYAHILDPRTRQPVEGMAGVTVLTTNAVEADALSTTLFVLGTNAGVRVLAAVGRADALFIPDRQPLEIWMTPGFAARFRAVPEAASACRTLGACGSAH